MYFCSCSRQFRSSGSKTPRQVPRVGGSSSLGLQNEASQLKLNIRTLSIKVSQWAKQPFAEIILYIYIFIITLVIFSCFTFLFIYNIIAIQKDNVIVFSLIEILLFHNYEMFQDRIEFFLYSSGCFILEPFIISK